MAVYDVEVELTISKVFRIEADDDADLSYIVDELLYEDEASDLHSWDWLDREDCAEKKGTENV